MMKICAKKMNENTENEIVFSKDFLWFHELYFGDKSLDQLAAHPDKGWQISFQFTAR